MEITNWLPEHSAALRDLRARGMSYSEIADTINKRFHTAYTRYAALSRGQRMGLGGLERPEPSLSHRGDRPESTVPVRPRIEVAHETRREPKADAFRWPKSFSGEVQTPQLRCVEITPRHLSLVELERGDCRYPYGGDRDDEPITFCGHPRREGSRSCTPHFHLSRDPEASAAPVLSTAWLRVVGVT